MSVSVILVAPQMSENIGAAARAMKNFGIYNLRIVNPRSGWPDEKSVSVAAGAADIIADAQIFSNIPDAVRDLNYIYAATARPRESNKECISVEKLIEDLPLNSRIGIMFGRESSGLSNREIAYANKILTINTNSSYGSLNLAQSVVVICHRLSGTTANIKQSIAKDGVTYEEYEHFYDHLFHLLEEKRFFRDLKRRERMQLKIRNIFAKIDNLTKNEIQTLRGIIATLSKEN